MWYQMFCHCSFMGVLFSTFLGKKSLAFRPLLWRKYYRVTEPHYSQASSSYISCCYLRIVHVSPHGQRGWLTACLPPCVTDHTVGHNHWPIVIMTPHSSELFLPEVDLQILLINLKPKTLPGYLVCVCLLKTQWNNSHRHMLAYAWSLHKTILDTAWGKSKQSDKRRLRN